VEGKTGKKTTKKTPKTYNNTYVRLFCLKVKGTCSIIFLENGWKKFAK
jgi:hypothetical protein